MRNFYLTLALVMVACIGCQWQLKPADSEQDTATITIERYDRIEHLYLTSADFAALQQMKTAYPQQTRALIEDVLKLGRVDETDMNTRLLVFFQDSTLQVLMREVEQQYADIDDLNRQLNEAFARLREMLPGLEVPCVYTQIGSLDQSIIIGKGMLGISLDKYLGTDNPLYLRYGYSYEQRQMMNRQFIVPDCIGFYLLSLYPAPDGDEAAHMGVIQFVVNKTIGRRLFDRPEVAAVERFAKQHPELTVGDLLSGAR